VHRQELRLYREQADAGLIAHVRRGEAAPVDAIEASLAGDPEAFRARARAFVSAKGDVNRYIADAIRAAVEKYGKARQRHAG
jgi:hypothetical protein